MGTILEAVAVRPSGAALAADVTGIDLSRPLDDEAFAAVHRAWLDHLVLRFRGQSMALGALEEFSRRFGTLDKAPINPKGVPHIPEHPDVAVMSNIVRDGVPIGSLGAGEAIWHTDMSYKEETPTASILYAAEVPPAGGNTNFANMYRAWETLPGDLKRRCEELECKHDASTNSAGERRKGFEHVTDPREVPGAVHPVVRTHPETGRKALFLGRRRNAWLVGLPLDESEALLDELWANATRPENIWSQEWKVGDVLMWDNRCVIHHRDSFDPDARRLLYRTQVQGDRPY